VNNAQDTVRPDNKLSVRQYALRIRTWIRDHPRRPPAAPAAPGQRPARRKPAPAVIAERALSSMIPTTNLPISASPWPP
jgi:hypothetical protein